MKCIVVCGKHQEEKISREISEEVSKKPRYRNNKIVKFINRIGIKKTEKLLREKFPNRDKYIEQLANDSFVVNVEDVAPLQNDILRNSSCLFLYLNYTSAVKDMFNFIEKSVKRMYTNKRVEWHFSKNIYKGDIIMVEFLVDYKNPGIYNKAKYTGIEFISSLLDLIISRP